MAKTGAASEPEHITDPEQMAQDSDFEMEDATMDPSSDPQAAPALCQAGWQDKHAFGTIRRLYPTRNGCYVYLNNPTPRRPQGDAFHLLRSHQNYNSLYALILASAINGYRVKIRTDATITSAAVATVCYITVDF